MNCPPHDLAVPCPACGSTSTAEFLRQTGVPVHQNRLFKSREAACTVRRGTLALRICNECDFVFNSAFEPALLDYGVDYDNNQTCSSAFKDYLDGVVQQVFEQIALQDCRVIEIGCGQGTFLRKLIQRTGNHVRGIGFDPAYRGSDQDLEGRLRFLRAFYSRDNAVEADVVVCRHVIEHVARPSELLKAVIEGLAGGKNVRFFFETPCLAWILQHRVIWDIFYEHCSLFTHSSFSRLFEEAGLRVQRVRHVFGDQYLWLEASSDGPSRQVVSNTRIRQQAKDFGCHWHREVAYWKAFVTNLHSVGPLAIWGAGAKGTTFCNLVDPDMKQVRCLVDVNSEKQGKFIAGTGHRIIGPNDLASEDPRTVLVLNPNYFAEVARDLRNLGSHARVCVLDQEGGAACA
jgi:SAM-dependent methyltransferase